MTPVEHPVTVAFYGFVLPTDTHLACSSSGMKTDLVRGYSASKQQLLTRLAPVEGQVRGAADSRQGKLLIVHGVAIPARPVAVAGTVQTLRQCLTPKSWQPGSPLPNS